MLEDSNPYGCDPITAFKADKCSNTSIRGG